MEHSIGFWRSCLLHSKMSNKPYVGFQQGRKDSGRLHGKISPNPKIYTKYQMDAQYILYSDCTENSDCDASCKPGRSEPLSPNCPLPPILQLAPASNYPSSSFSSRTLSVHSSPTTVDCLLLLPPSSILSQTPSQCPLWSFWSAEYSSFFVSIMIQSWRVLCLYLS